VESQTPSTSSSDTKHESENNKVDVGLVLKLQHKLAEVEREKVRMQKRLDELDMSPRTEKAENAARDSIRISELELVNSNLKAQVMELQNSILEGTGSSKIHEQLQLMQSEQDRKTEEIVQLKSVLANQTNNMKSIVNSNNTIGDLCLFGCGLFLIVLLQERTLMKMESWLWPMRRRKRSTNNSSWNCRTKI
jgi:hypothetical protein